MFNVLVVTCSDKGSIGEREDTSGDYIKNKLNNEGYNVVEKIIVPDDFEIITKILIYGSDELEVDLIITTGGTGFAQRDITPEATKSVIKKDVPGISEFLRYEGSFSTKKSFLSRGVSGIRDKTLIINLPGSLKAVKENLDSLLKILDHGLGILASRDIECGN